MNSDFCRGVVDWTRLGREGLPGSVVRLFMVGLNQKQEMVAQAVGDSLAKDKLGAAVGTGDVGISHSEQYSG